MKLARSLSVIAVGSYAAGHVCHSISKHNLPLALLLCLALGLAIGEIASRLHK